MYINPREMGMASSAQCEEFDIQNTYEMESAVAALGCAHASTPFSPSPRPPPPKRRTEP